MTNGSGKPDKRHQADAKGVSARACQKRKRRLTWVVCLLGLFLLVAYFTYTPIISSIISDKLQNAIETRLHAELKYDSLTYSFPYSVRLKNVRLQTDSTLGDQDLLSIEQLDLSLARLPLPHRPVVIKSLELRSPSVRIVHSSSGIVGAMGLQRSDEEVRANPPEHRLSEMFELRKFAIADGRVTYEDRTIDNTEPLVFGGITVDLGVTPASHAIYGFQMHTGAPPFATIDAGGTMDIDAVVMDLKQFAISAECKRVDGESSLPPKIQRVLDQLGISGKITVSGSGHWPMRDTSGASASAVVSVVDARASFPKVRGRIDRLDAAAHIELRDGQTRVDLTQFTVQSAAARITIPKAAAHGNIEQWKLEPFNGVIDCISPGATTQPAAIVNTQLLGGRIELAGEASGARNATSHFSLIATPRDVSLLPPGFSQAIDHVTGEVRIGPERIEFWKMAGDCLGGQIGVRAILNLPKPVKYDVELESSNLDVAQVVSMPFMRGKVAALTGQGDLDAHLTGSFPQDGTSALDQMSVDGKARITRGRFWNSAMLSKITDNIGMSRDSLNTGDAAAVFTIRQRTVTIQRGAINTGVLGFHGKGTVTFDGEANLDIIAAPLGNWRKHIEQANIPIIGGMASNIAGTFQRLVSATSRLLYEFQVTGKLSDPQIRAVPAPALTDGAANIFGSMLQNVKSSDLLKSLQEGD